LLGVATIIIGTILANMDALKQLISKPSLTISEFLYETVE
jgi:hypothetical protein